MAKMGLFSLILIIGTIAILVAGETKSLALADLSAASVQTMTTAAHGEVLYAGARSNGNQLTLKPSIGGCLGEVL
jgi:hypothetical protein